MPDHLLAGPPRLLDAHPLFRSRDIDEAREQVARAFCSHDLRQTRAGQRLDCRHNRVAFGALALNYLSYGADVAIEPGCLDRFYLVQIPLTGSADIRCGGARVLSDPATAVILSPHKPTVMHWQADSAQVLLRIPRELMERRMAETFGAGPGPFEFELALPQQSGPTAAWCRTVVDLARNIDANGTDWLRHEAAVASMEEFLLRGLMFLHRHDLSERLQTPAPAPMPRHLRRALEFIEAHAGEAVTVADIARAACVSVRALEEGFRRHQGTTPGGYLREVRLVRIRDSLRAAAEGGMPVSITEIAHRYGFFHLGRFAAYYKARFGESPSATLRRH